VPASDAALESAAAIVGGELNWSDERRHEEIASVKRFYDLSTARSGHNNKRQE